MARAIMISDHLYGELLQLKKQGQSFTKVIDGMLHRVYSSKKKQTYDLSRFAGAWNVLSKDYADGIEKVAKQTRKNWRPASTW